MRVRVNMVLDVDEEAFNGDIQEVLEDMLVEFMYDVDDTEVSKISVVIPR